MNKLRLSILKLLQTEDKNIHKEKEVLYRPEGRGISGKSYQPLKNLYGIEIEILEMT